MGSHAHRSSCHFCHIFMNLATKIMDLWISKCPTDFLRTNIGKWKHFFWKVKAIFYGVKHQASKNSPSLWRPIIQTSHMRSYFSALTTAKNRWANDNHWPSRCELVLFAVSQFLFAVSWFFLLWVISFCRDSCGPPSKCSEMNSDLFILFLYSRKIMTVFKIVIWYASRITGFVHGFRVLLLFWVPSVYLML